MPCRLVLHCYCERPCALPCAMTKCQARAADPDWAEASLPALLMGRRSACPALFSRRTTSIPASVEHYSQRPIYLVLFFSYASASLFLIGEVLSRLEAESRAKAVSMRCGSKVWQPCIGVTRTLSVLVRSRET